MKHKFNRIYNGKVLIFNGEEPKRTYPVIQEEIEVPVELLEIASEWYNLSKETGDKGCCVVGARMEFKYKEIEYKMYPQSPWQGELSWTPHKELIMDKLKEIGATDIYYEWGMMD